MEDLELQFIASNLDSSILAGEMYSKYLDRKGTSMRVVADFLIGSHAQLHAERLLARDREYYRDYFKKLKILNPQELG